MTVDMLKTLMNQTLLDNFPDTNVESAVEPNRTLVSAVEIANQSYNALISRMPAKAVVRFDSQSFQIKTALCHIYEYVLQDKAILHNLSLQSMSLSEQDVFNNYYQLLKLEKEELADMRKEALDEIKDKDEDSSKSGVMLYHRYPTRRRF